MAGIAARAPKHSTSRSVSQHAFTPTVESGPFRSQRGQVAKIIVIGDAIEIERLTPTPAPSTCEWLQAATMALHPAQAIVRQHIVNGLLRYSCIHVRELVVNWSALGDHARRDGRNHIRRDVQ